MLGLYGNLANGIFTVVALEGATFPVTLNIDP